MTIEILMIVGFCLAAYSIVGNDVPQTLGTFISSNAHRPWWVLWLYTSSILVVVLLYGWFASGTGDASYGRLETIPFPETGITWLYIVPPILLIILTKYGIPVSTTFLVLTIFSPSSLSAMLTKSMMGYAVAFVVAILVYRFVMKGISIYLSKTRHKEPSHIWIGLQWVSTAFLWSQWLIQDLANIFVYVPRQVPFEFLIFGILVFVVLLGWIFYRRGGAIQNIIDTKTGVADIRAATIIDFMYAIILLVFKEWSNIPMSTTWVFLGLLAGREFALSMHLAEVNKYRTSRNVSKDAMKLMFGLAISVLLATGLPWLYQHISG
ncbi:hypothetical protein ACUM6W_13415 [Acinetobacter tandoii]|jgi:hypothetical protein|uniref:Phosphate/sulfate permease n=3 Tax=Gammaproteobacteria TaxID=1236 RepID=R9AQX0_9GAMM|nr:MULTISPECIES: hypothetical protein [Acinetobacter]EOR04450.1 hypothetical protein I593_03535 [Acinetobacter tandoii DSM 14970 = CIP 107469]KAB1852892.1 hypothetical protein F4W09_13625 [Acinetobacter tandoii]UOG17430.1 hypothetical protein MP622_13165 [Acinetobacter sp. PK01]